MSYSQNREDLFVLNYFGDYKGTLLEIGANNGIDLSNSKLLIENGWFAHLVEPGKTNSELYQLHKDNPNVVTYDVAIGNEDKFVTFYESGCHVASGEDRGLVSTIDFEETKRWPNVEFEERSVYMVSWETIYNKHLRTPNSNIDYISIDAEGFDNIILQQINLKKVGCHCLCIEWNSNSELKTLFTNYCADFGMTLAHENAENLIFTI